MVFSHLYFRRRPFKLLVNSTYYMTSNDEVISYQLRYLGNISDCKYFGEEMDNSTSKSKSNTTVQQDKQSQIPFENDSKELNVIKPVLRFCFCRCQRSTDSMMKQFIEIKNTVPGACFSIVWVIL